MTINKLTDSVKHTDQVYKINEIIDDINNQVVITVDSELNESSTNPIQNAVVTAALSEKQDLLTVGDNITIEGGIISAVDTTYTAGSGISISDEGVISNTQTSAEWGNIQGELSEQSDLVTILDTKQDIANLVTTISLSSSDVEYPSAKAVYDTVANAEYEIGIESYEDGALALRGNTEYHPSTPSVDSNFLPKGTVIHVELDGSGDFTTVKDAFDYLEGKWSNGEITIELGNGTFEIGENTHVSTSSYNIPSLFLKGQGIDNTIVTCKGTTNYTYFYKINRIFFSISYLTLKREYGNKNTQYRGLAVEHGGHLTLRSVKIIGCIDAVMSGSGGIVIIADRLDIFNSANGLSAMSGIIQGEWGASYNFNNVNYATYVNGGGFITLTGSGTYSKINVSNVSNVSNGTINTNGYISIPF